MFTRIVWLLLVLIAFLFVSCSADEKTEKGKTESSKTVMATKINKVNISIPVAGIGTLSSKSQSNLSFLTGGLISEIRVSEGQEVRAGTLLASLNMTEINNRYKQASLGLEKAKRDFQRVENLYKDTVVSLEQFQNVKTALELAESNVEIAKFNKANSEIRAPANGKILKRLKEENEITSPGYPVLVFASVESAWVLTVNLSDRDVVKINRGDSARIYFDAYPNQSFKAEVFEIAGVSNLLSGTYEVELKLLQKPTRLVTGLIGSAEIFTGAKSYFQIPAEAIVDVEERIASVFLVRNNKPQWMQVQIESLTDTGILVLGDLLSDDLIITDGSSWLKEEDVINVIISK